MLDLPATVLPAWLVTLAAGHRPLGCADDMRRIATGWRDAGATLTELADEVAAAAAYGAGLAAGTTAVAVAQHMAEREQVLRDLAECAGSLADQVVDGARHIEFLQLTVDLTMWAVAIQVGYAVVLPHGAVLTLAARIWAQQKFRTSLARTLARLLLEGAEYVAKRPILAVPLQGGVSGALEGGTTDALAQRIQIREDNREVVDTRSVLVSTAEGISGGIGGEAGARWLAPGVARMAQPVARVVGVPVARALQVLALGGAGGLFGAPAGMAVSIVAAGGDPRDVTAQEWLEGLVTGTGGGVIGAAGYGLRSTAAPLPVPSLESARLPNEPASTPESATGPGASKSRDVPVAEQADAISAPSHISASPPDPAETPPVTLRADGGGELIVGVAPQSTTNLPDRVPTGPWADELVSTTAAGQVIDRAPTDTAPGQPVDQLPDPESTPTESAPAQPGPGTEPTGAAHRDIAHGIQRNGPEYAATEPDTADRPQAEHPATTGTAANVPPSDDRLRSLPSETTPERGLSDTSFTDESTASQARLGAVESEPPAPESSSGQPDGIDVPPIPAVTTDTPAQRPAPNPTAGAIRTPAGAPAPATPTRAPEPGHKPRPGSGPDKSRPRVLAPNDPTRRAGTTAPGRHGVTAPVDHTAGPPLPDQTTAPKQHTPETDALAAAATSPQVSPPSAPTENQAKKTPEGTQSTRRRADIDVAPSGPEPAPGPLHRPEAEVPSSSPIPEPTVRHPAELSEAHAADATDPVSSKPADTPHDQSHEPDSDPAPDSPFQPAPYAFDVSLHLALNRRRNDLFEAADTMLLDTERSLQTMWSTPSVERQLAEVRDPALRADGLQQRVDTLRDKGISPRRIAELDAAVHRALDTHHEIAATVRTGAQRMQHILRAYADDSMAPSTWRDPRSTEPEPPCGPATLVALQALFPDTHRHVPDVVGTSEPSRQTPWSTDPTAWSYMLGNRAEPVGSGAAAHRRTTEMLAGPPGEAPMPGRGAGAARRVVVISDAYSKDPTSDSAHTYLAAKLNNGELVRLDLTFDTGPRRLEAPSDQVLHRKVYALDRHGMALEPAPTSKPHRRFPSLAGRPPSGDPAHPGGRPVSHDPDTAGVHDRAPVTGTDETAPAARIEPAATRINEPAPTTHVEPFPAMRADKPASTSHIEPAAATRASEPAQTPPAEPVPTADRESEFGPRIGELEPSTHVEAVPVDSHPPGLRGWLLRMATNPVGMLMSGSLGASLGASVTGMSAAMLVSMLATPWLGSMVLTARNLATLLTTLPAGYVADRFNQRRVVRTCTFIGLGGAATSLVAMFSSGFLAPVAVAVAVAAGIFTYTAAEGIRRPSQARLAERYAQNRPDNEQKEVGRLDILARQSSATLGSFLGPIFANLHPAVPFAVKGVSSLLNLRAVRKVHRDFGEPPQLGEKNAERRPHAKPEDTPLVNETAPGTVVNRPSSDTKVEPDVGNAPRDGGNRLHQPEGAENRPHQPEDNESRTEPATTARDTPEEDGRDTEPAPTDQAPAEPAEPRSWWVRAKDGIVAMFGPVWQDRYLRGITLVVAPLSGLATGMQSARIVEYMTHMGWWAGVLGAAAGAFGIAGAVLGVLSFKKSTVKSLEPMTTTIWAATALPSAIWLNPFLILPSMAATSVLGLAANVKMADYMHEVDMRNSGGKQIGRMRAASALMATGAMTAGTAGGGILLQASGLAVTGFAQVGVLAVAAAASGYYGFRHRKPHRTSAEGNSGP